MHARGTSRRRRAALCASALVAALAGTAAVAGASVGPAIVVLQAPAASTTASHAIVRWRVDGGDPSRCRLDRSAARACSSPFVVDGLDPGRHTLSIEAGADTASVQRVVSWRVAATGHPVARTVGSTFTSATSARLTAAVSPTGLRTTAHFEFGRTRQLALVTPTRSLGSGSTATLRDSITDLKPGSTYYYRVVARNADGTVRGATMTLSVDAPAAVSAAAPAVDPPKVSDPVPAVDPPTAGNPVPPPVAGAPALVQGTAVTSTAGDLVAHATVDPGGSDSTVWAEYGGLAYGQSTAPVILAGTAGPTPVAVALPTLAPGAYHLRLVVQRPSDTTYGADVSFTVAPPLVAPELHTGAASSAGSSWSVGGSVDPGAAAASVWVEYGTTSAYGSVGPSSTIAGGTGSVAVTAALGALQPDTAYHYRLVAQNVAGTSYGADATFSTAAPSGTFVATTGDDTADGSYSHPWRTLQKAANTVAAGTTVNVRGGTYVGFAMTRSGSAGAPIVFAGYNGETAVVTPPSGTNTIDVNGAHDVVLRNLTVQGALGQYNAGVMIRGGSSDITVTGCVLAHNHSYGIRLYNDTDVTVENNLITQNDTGVRIDFLGEGTVVSDNQIVDNQGMVVDDPTPGNDTGANGIVFYKSTGHVLVSGNTINGNRAPSDDYGYDGGAFEIFGASNVTMVDNVAYDNQNIVETGTDANHTACANNVFAHNVGYGGNDKSLVSTYGPVANGLILRCAQNMLIANNTFVDLDFYIYDISQSSTFSGSIDGLHIENNVNLQHHDKIYAFELALPASVVIDANDDFNEGGGTLASVAGHPNTSAIADIRTWANADVHGVYADPRVASESGRDFRLAAGSPAIDLGLAIATVTDGFAGSAPDAGRFESP